MKKSILLFIFAASTTLAQNISETNIKAHITYLASDSLEGRGTGTRGEQKANEYIVKQFTQFNLTPKGKNNTFLYPFTFKKNTNPHDTSTVNIPERSGTNVVAFLDNGAANTVVIGAHYDHLGYGHDHNSLDANPEGKIHNGADDNASGVAGVIELARYYSSNNIKEKNNFLFMCFSGEELGLLGSKKYCDDPTVDLKTVNYMINMDMIGRLNDSTKKVIVYGVGTAPDFVPLLDELKGPFSIKKDSSGIGPSDQTSFYLKDVPVLHFFTGQHSMYHKPGDDVELINVPGERQVLEYIVALVSELEKKPKLQFLKTKNAETKSTKFKVTLGVMPDYAFEGKGMRVDGVTEGKPAHGGGVLKGDVVIKLGEVVINNMQDYMTGLSKFNKGDTAPVKVLRDGKEVELKVTF